MTNYRMTSVDDAGTIPPAIDYRTADRMTAGRELVAARLVTMRDTAGAEITAPADVWHVAGGTR